MSSTPETTAPPAASDTGSRYRDLAREWVDAHPLTEVSADQTAAAAYALRRLLGVSR